MKLMVLYQLKKRFFDLKENIFNKGPNIKLIEKKLLNTIKKHLSDVKIGLLLVEAWTQVF